MDIRAEFEAWWRDFEPDCIFERFSDNNALGYPPGVYTVARLQYAYEAYQAGRRAGAEDMRNQTAKVCDGYAAKSSNPMNFAENCADAIRARGKE